MRPNSVEVRSFHCYKLELASSASAFYKTSKSFGGKRSAAKYLLPIALVLLFFG